MTAAPPSVDAPRPDSSRPEPPRTRPLAAAALVATSLLVLGVALELAFVPLLHYLPRKLHVYLDPALRPLAQSSKRATLPRDYVALVGDSNAQGRGDWLLESDANGNGPYASAHVLHERSGRDVISWGRGGAGFVSGWVAFPELSWRALQSSRRTAIAPPDLLIAYFYEGNDLEDTQLELVMLAVLDDPELPRDTDPNEVLKRMGLAESRARMLRDEGLRDPQHFDALVESRFLPQLESKIGAPAPGWRPALYFPRFIGALLAGEFERLRGHAPTWDWEGRGYFGKNHVRLGDRVVEVPGSLQSPGMELTPDEIELSLHTGDLALGMLASAFPDSALCLLRVPSPATLYEFDEAQVSVQGLRNTPGAPGAEIRARSDELGQRAQELALRHGARFVDALPPLREAAQRELVHGPRDWRHLNRLGQTVLGETAQACLAAPAPARTRDAAADRAP
ncbi:MAG TPA: hypothetical protein VMS55_28180 [Myxococcota bacterium]|nr:hypothetical protein [Myxococcota bacterium]